MLEAALSGQALYYHWIGTPQSQDRLVYERRDPPAWIINGEVTEDGRYLLIAMFEGPWIRACSRRRRSSPRPGTGRVFHSF